jgi:FtsH-binding integral membrane protein
MWAQPYRKNDLEAGARPLYPMMLESPELRWSFIRKIYSILAVQLLVTIAVAGVVVSVPPIATFFVSTGGGLALYIVLIFVPFLGMSPLCFAKSSFGSNVFVLLSFCFVNFDFFFLIFFFFVGNLAVLCPLYYYHQKHPLNYFLLGIFTISLAFVVGLTCAFTSGK